MSVKIDQILEETKRFKDQNPTILNGMIMSGEILLNKLARLVPKIRGEFATVNSVLGHVIQQFTPTWTDMADVQFRGKQMRNYHQKVNFSFTPAEIIGSWIEQKYDEGVTEKDKSISKHVMTMLQNKVISDVNILSVTAKFDATKPNVFGFSMNGLNEIHKQLLVNTENPCFIIPTDAIDENNILDVVLEFEKGIPKDYKSTITNIKMSDTNADNYSLKYEDVYGKNTNYTDEKGLRTRLGKRRIVAIPRMSDNIIEATLDGNLVRLIDVIENPGTITDVQKLDYKIKVFGEFTLGYDYAVNELVILNSSTVSERGLRNAELNKLYYPEEIFV